jgi:hypothetical protein
LKKISLKLSAKAKGYPKEAQFCTDFKKVQNSCVMQKAKNVTEKLIFLGTSAKKPFLGEKS